MLDNVTRPKGRVEFYRVLCKLVSLSFSELALVTKKACAKPVDNRIDLIDEEDLAVAPLAAAYERLRVPLVLIFPIDLKHRICLSDSTTQHDSFFLSD